MDKEKNKRLVSTAYDVIDEENLPRPKDIRLRPSLGGTISRRGTCQKMYGTDYKILVHTSKAKFIKCATGNLTNRKTGEKYRRAIGEELSYERLVKIMAHEIAHLKFWKHDAQHKSYTDHILSILNFRLGVAQ